MTYDYVRNLLKMPGSQKIYDLFNNFLDWLQKFWSTNGIPKLTYECCFRCHSSLPAKQDRNNTNLCEMCYETELQIIFAEIIRNLCY